MVWIGVGVASPTISDVTGVGSYDELLKICTVARAVLPEAPLGAAATYCYAAQCGGAFATFPQYCSLRLRRARQVLSCNLGQMASLNSCS